MNPPSASASSSPITPTFYGHITTTRDALVLFEACLSGALKHVARRPHDRERASLIRSGNVFIYEEHCSGVKRWTDGVPWSPSRILGNFLIYRELERPFPPGEKKRAMKRDKKSPASSKSEYGSFGSDLGNPASSGSSTLDDAGNSALSKETERSLIGSLVDSYGFKQAGLVKKTVSVTVGGVSHHLVSYYTIEDVMNNKFTTPSNDPRFRHITPRSDLTTRQNFRTPLDEEGSIDERSIFASYSGNMYEPNNQNISYQQPAPSITYAPNLSSYGNYGTASRLQYESVGQSSAIGPFGNDFSLSSSINPVPKSQNYDLSGFRQQRYNSVIGITSEISRTHVLPVDANFARRGSNFQQGNMINGVLEETSVVSMDSKLGPDFGYPAQGFHGDLRVVTTLPNYNHRSLPTPTQPPIYQRQLSQSYHQVESLNMKEHMWSLGNTSDGHGHYTSPP